ncbi:photoreceptor cilium actin regulator [Dromiciops gliroides]|uniref:photoreceptor cilium actin regulator n=1 Tax=Dromiciops gliroides TaxID=33562 RepID=UPI001CC7396C|nr:photoreceptor cilium actin regulator [Dromiciops gliroides]
MGCAPSHSDIVNSMTRSGIQFWKKPKTILSAHRAGREGLSIPLLVQGSTCYGEASPQVQRQQAREHPDLRRDQNMARSLRLFPGNPSPGRRREPEDAALEAEAAMSEIIDSQKHLTKDTQVESQNSSREDFYGNKQKGRCAKESSKKRKSATDRILGKESGHCQAQDFLAYGPEDKVDFPEALVTAHHRAYAFLHPSLSRYEAILGIAHEAAQTQQYLQQMVVFLLWRFDEINKLLGEIANDGEVLLQEAGAHLAWPDEKEGPPWQPDLLQQLLQYTANRMQVLHHTVTSLTSSALQDSSSYLHSAAQHLDKKLETKRELDQCLLKAIRILKNCVASPSTPKVDDRPLYSEDSGIGADNESLHSVDRLGKQTSWDSLDEPTEKKPWLSYHRETKVAADAWQHHPSASGSSRPQDCALERQRAHLAAPGIPFHADEMPANTLCRSLQPGTRSSHNALKTGAPEKGEHFGGYGLTIPLPLTDEEDSTPEEEEDNDDEDGPPGLSHNQTGTRSLRPTTSPALAESVVWPHFKRIETPHAQEMILKMKDAISERIKFVPAQPAYKEWTEDEERKVILPPRPSTVCEGRRSSGRPKRSKSEESLKGHAEDPTLLELQRVQKDLSQRLEMFYGFRKKRRMQNKEEHGVPRTAVLYLHSRGRPTQGSSISKLKASLAKNLSILPSQEKIGLQKPDPKSKSQQPSQGKAEALSKVTTPVQEYISWERESKAPETRGWSGEGCSPRPSVKKLIETFSPNEEMLPPMSPRPSGEVSGTKKFGVPIMPCRFPIYRGLAPLYPKHPISPGTPGEPPKLGPNWRPFAPVFTPLPTVVQVSKSAPNSETEEDLQDLPPPPPEILMDNSFNSLKSPGDPETGVCPAEVPNKLSPGGPPPTRKTSASQRLKASLNSIDLLPNKNIPNPIPPSEKGSGHSKTERKARNVSLELIHAPGTSHNQERPGVAQREPEAEETASLNKQPHKVIPLPHPNSIAGLKGNKEACISRPPQPEGPRQGQDKSPGLVRKMSPTRSHWSHRTEKRNLSPPASHRPTGLPTQPSLPHVQRQSSPPFSPRTSPPVRARTPSPPTSPKTTSPPASRKSTSPLLQHKNPSSPTEVPQSPPPPQELSGPPIIHREVSTPPFCSTPTPPTSPSQEPKEPSSWGESDPAPAKVAPNTCSIFCPATSSLFEAKSLSSPKEPHTEGGEHLEMGTEAKRNLVLPRQWGEPQKRMALCALNPQPFIRRTASDHRPRVRLRLPGSASVGTASELCSQTSSEESPPKEAPPLNSLCLLDMKGSSKWASHPDLYVVGRGLQRE